MNSPAARPSRNQEAINPFSSAFDRQPGTEARFAVSLGARVTAHHPSMTWRAFLEILPAREDHGAQSLRGIPFRRQAPLPVVNKGVRLECGYRMDIVVDQKVVLEIKAGRKVDPVSEAQVITYLKLGGYSTGLSLNFNVHVLKDGTKRFVN